MVGIDLLRFAGVALARAHRPDLRADSSPPHQPRIVESTMMSEQRRAEWTDRVASYAESARLKNQPFAEALIEVMAPPAGARVLDVATGPGIVAVLAAKHVGPTGSVLATDFAPEWEPHVFGAAAEAGVSNVRFAV